MDQNQTSTFINEVVPKLPALARAVYYYQTGDAEQLAAVLKEHAPEIKKNRPDLLQYASKDTTPACVVVLCDAGWSLDVPPGFPIDMNKLEKNMQPEAFSALLKHNPDAAQRMGEYVMLTPPPVEDLADYQLVLDTLKSQRDEREVLHFQGVKLSGIETDVTAVYEDCTITNCTITNGVFAGNTRINNSEISQSIIHADNGSVVIRKSRVNGSLVHDALSVTTRFGDSVLRGGNHLNAKIDDEEAFLDGPTEAAKEKLTALANSARPSALAAMATLAQVSEGELLQVLDMDMEHVGSQRFALVGLSADTRFLPVWNEKSEVRPPLAQETIPPKLRGAQHVQFLSPAHRGSIINLMLKHDMPGQSVNHTYVRNDGSLYAGTRDYAQAEAGSNLSLFDGPGLESVFAEKAPAPDSGPAPGS